jgi:hypothetical protein
VSDPLIDGGFELLDALEYAATDALARDSTPARFSRSVQEPSRGSRLPHGQSQDIPQADPEGRVRSRFLNSSNRLSTLPQRLD